jgi:hypothetical protein
MRTLLITLVAASTAACTTTSSPTGDATDDFGGGGGKSDGETAVRLRHAVESGNGWAGMIDIADRGSDKDVTVVWRSEGATDATWHETPAQFRAVVDESHPWHQLWGFDGVGGDGVSELYVRYRAGGAEYVSEHYQARDRDNGFSAPLGEGLDVATFRASLARDAGSLALDVDVLVRNVAYEKEVSVVYSTDAWETVQSTEGQYADGVTLDGGAERWRVHVDLPADAEGVDYAVSATQAGAEAWDNSFGRNFGCVIDSGESQGPCWGLTLSGS